MNEPSEKDAGSSQFEQRVRSLLIDSSDALDGRTRSQLTQARYAALAARAAGTSKYAGWRGWAPAGAVAMAVLVTVLCIGHGGVNSPPAAPTGSSALDDLDLLADSDALALSADADQELDSDFYEWAATTGSGNEAGLGT